MRVWPDSLLAPEKLRWYPSRSAKASKTLGGQTRFASNDGGGVWMCEFSREVRDIERQKASLAILDMLDGGAGVIMIPYRQFGLAPLPAGVSGGSPGFSDGAVFGDGGTWVSGTVDVVLAADARVGDTVITVQPILSAPLTGGEPFSLWHLNLGKRMHRIVSVEPISGGFQVIEVRPPIREDTLAGMPLDFEGCAVPMHLTNAEDVLGQLSRPFKSLISPVFEEDFSQ